MSNPTPPVPGSPPVSGPSRETPGLGAGEQAQPRPFSLPPEAATKGKVVEEPGMGKPTPMEAAQTTGPRVSQQELGQHMEQLASKIRIAQNELSQRAQAHQLSPEHYNALVEVTQRLTPDLQKISRYAGSEFAPPPQETTKEGGALRYLLSYLEDSQGQMHNSVAFLANQSNPNITQMLTLQYTMQRASQKVELMSSIIGSSVGGIKTLMSMQLG